MPPMMSSGLASTGAGSGGASATAVEYTCLFTHDLRRKQKRWEDGRLKYHTFNRRVMVYDERGNFIGDTHWQRGWDLDEGEEFQLDRGSVIVQVVECVGHQEQDLSELLDKRAKEKEQRQARVATRPPVSVASPHTTPLPGSRPGDHFQTRHRPLNNLLGTPTGHHGRAVVPSESPFELRQRVNDNPRDEAESRAAKRRKCDAAPPTKTTFAQSLFGATLSLSAVPLSSAPPRRPTVSSTPRQPETQNEPPPSPEPVRPVDRALPSRAGTYSGVSRASVAVPRPRVLPEPISAALVRDEEAEEPLEAAPRAVTRPLAKPTSHPTAGAVRPPDAEIRRPSGSDDENPPMPAVDTTAPKRPKPIRTAVPSLLRKHLERSAEAAVVPEKGASFSQAIVLDEDDGHEPEKDRRPGALERQRQGVDTTGSKRAAPSLEKRKPVKRNKLLSLAAQPPTAVTKPPVEEPREERTELRLKPRQKRGLLFMAEKKNRTKQRKQREMTSEPHDTHDTTRTTTTTSISPPQPPLAQPAHPGSRTAQRYNPFASSPPDACDPAPRSRSPWAPSDEDQPVWETDGAANEATYPPEQRKPADKNLCDSEDDALSQPPSPRGRNENSGDDSPALARVEPTAASIADRGNLSAGSDAEATLSRSSRHTRRTRSTVGQGPSHARRQEPSSESSESDSDEFPLPPPRPHLARLGRKGIRSRELIGYLPSSSPIAPPPFGPGAPELRPAVAVTTTTLPGPSASEEVLIPADVALPLAEPEKSPSSPPRALSRTTSPAGQGHSSQLGTTAVGAIAIEGPSEEQTDVAKSTPQSPPRRSPTRHTPAVSPRGDRMDDSAATKVSTGDLDSFAVPEEETWPTTTVRKGVNALAQTTRATRAADNTSGALRRSTPLGSSSLINPQHHHEQQEEPKPEKSLTINNNNQPTPTAVNAGVTHPANTRPRGPPPSLPPPPPAAAAAAAAPPPPLPAAAPASVAATAVAPLPAAAPASVAAATAALARPSLPAAPPVSVTGAVSAPPPLPAAALLSVAPPPLRPPEAAPAPAPVSVPAPDAPLAPATRPRIANPATRGRKAALKSHAAGQAPQPVLPALLPEGLQQQYHHQMAAAAARMEARGAVVVAGVSERPKRTMRFPGFVSVGGGGPWSREAFDLLEGGRPGAG